MKTNTETPTDEQLSVYPTSVHLTMGMMRDLDEIAYRAKQMHRLHPMRARMKLVRYAVERFLDSPEEIEAALEVGADGLS